MRTHSTQSVLYVIRHKQSGEFIKFGTKIGWASSGAAKNAFRIHMSSWGEEKKLDNSNEYELFCVNSLLVG